ncbi:protein arginine kinase [Tissierella carlieri]|uniref:Protein-arginine kinase n=1 Tax=Tissierella carlieri TaxID=689904 RepID=A0ABT1SDT3_9FIRM|nr:protein arginine kinase [Tissierella carlieri]
MAKWLDSEGKEEDVVVSTRLRIARNMANYKFPDFMTMDESEYVTEEVLGVMKNKEDIYRFYRIKDLSELESSVLVEEHLISPNLAQNTRNGSFLLRDDEKATIMINEEDHIRIQVLLYGLNIEEGWRICSSIDDSLEGNIEYAFHEKFGYLTSCPTNVGTGLRASVMVHLPCLAMTGHLNTIIDGLSKIGLTARGLYGEGSKALGHLFQISNQTTLGEKEEDIIKKLNKVILQIVSRERSTRAYMMDKRSLELEDKVFRSLGILNYSRLISSAEAMAHLSNVKLGCDMGIIKGMNPKDIVKLMIDIQPASIQMNLYRDMLKDERDMYRAQIIRNNLINMEG